MARHNVDWRRITHVALTHFHADHLGDLGPFLFALKHGLEATRVEPITILGPPGTRAVVENLAGVYGSSVLDPGFPVRVVELGGSGIWSDCDGQLLIRWFPTRHTENSVAYRVEYEESSVGYTGDTGPDSALAAFLSGVDVLLLECSHPDPPRFDNHLTPAGAAGLLDAARPRVAVTTHVYRTLDPARVPDLIRSAGYLGSVVPGRDGLHLEAAGGSVRVAGGDT